jgi:hypothetical protein
MNVDTEVVSRSPTGDSTEKLGGNMKHALLAILLVMAGIVGLAASATAATANPASVAITGSVQCAQGKPVTGIWVNSSLGGSGWAGTLKGHDATVSYFRYPAAHGTVSLPWGTYINIHVGCGVTGTKWASDNQRQVSSCTTQDILLSMPTHVSPRHGSMPRRFEACARSHLREALNLRQLIPSEQLIPARRAIAHAARLTCGSRIQVTTRRGEMMQVVGHLMQLQWDGRFFLIQ